MEKEIFGIYEKLSENIPVYHDLVKISREHPKAMDLFEKIYNQDNYAHFLSRAADAMQDAVNPDNVDRIERMVNAFNSKKLENLWETDAFKHYKSKYSYEGEGSLREKISKMKAKAGIIDEHKNADPNKKVKDMGVDLLADKMKFIEKRVSLVRENGCMVIREQEDKIRISAYKDFKAQSK